MTGRRPALLGEPYGADMRLFINEGGTPCVIFGPGDVKVAHSADEHVPLDEVEACARVLAAWVVRELGWPAQAGPVGGVEGAPARPSGSRPGRRRGPRRARRAPRSPAAATRTPEPSDASAEVLQISASATPWTRVRSTIETPLVSSALPAT